MRYEVILNVRQNGALGKFEPMSFIVEEQDPHAAKQKAYQEAYEQGLSVQMPVNVIHVGD